MLTLPIKKKWFDMIVSGEKKEEYRTISNYYRQRLNITKRCILRNGYSRDRPKIGIDFELSVGCGKKEWGAVKDEIYFILKIIDIWNVVDKYKTKQ